MGFKYKYTCPIIDECNNNIKNKIEAFLEDILSGLNLDCDIIVKLRYRLYNEIEKDIDIIRCSNEDMRSEAERQIGELEERCKELEDEISELIIK